MKKTIRLTESDLHRVIRRAVYEATKGEMGMSDKQKQRRRNANYIKDVNGSGDKYFHPNTYSDYEPSNVDRYERNAPFHGNDWFDDKVHMDRIKKHRSSQNHKDPDDFMESVIRESIKKVINEEWYPENENDIDDYYYGAIFKFDTDLVYFDEGENIPEDLLNIKEEYIDSENTYVSVMVTNVEPEMDETDGSASFTITAAINAPNMPLDEIEEEVTNTVWVWLENKLNKRFTRVWIEDEKVVYDRRSVE